MPFLGLLVPIGNPWHSLACRLNTPVSESVFTWTSSLCGSVCPNLPLLIRMPVNGLGPTLHSINLNATPLHPQNPTSKQSNTHSYQGLRFEHLFGGTQSHPPQMQASHFSTTHQKPQRSHIGHLFLRPVKPHLPDICVHAGAVREAWAENGEGAHFY